MYIVHIFIDSIGKEGAKMTGDHIGPDGKWSVVVSCIM